MDLVPDSKRSSGKKALKRGMETHLSTRGATVVMNTGSRDYEVPALAADQATTRKGAVLTRARHVEEV
jgi:hypothetical protein